MTIDSIKVVIEHSLVTFKVIDKDTDTRYIDPTNAEA
jgi:hypothetical protein